MAQAAEAVFISLLWCGRASKTLPPRNVCYLSEVLIHNDPGHVSRVDVPTIGVNCLVVEKTCGEPGQVANVPYQANVAPPLSDPDQKEK